MEIVISIPNGEGGCACCGCADYQYYAKYHGSDECPTVGSGDPEGTCFPSENIGSCSGLTEDATLKSIVFHIDCLTGKSAKADVSMSFDDFGSIGTLNCNEVASCSTCGVSGTVVPSIEWVTATTFRLTLDIHAQNAYWGGPYGYYGWIKWYFE
jgi:hypothetical protein